jgi:AcrR family transcriptional regulator
MTNHSDRRDVLFGSSNMIWDALAHRRASIVRDSGVKRATQLTAKTSHQDDGRRERILDNAEKLFRRFGHAKTTMADIAWEVSVSRATIYRLFATKEALEAQVCARLATQTLREVRDSMADDERASEQLKTLLIELGQLTSFRMALDPHLHRLFAEAFHCQWALADEYLLEVRGLIRDTVVRGQVAQVFLPVNTLQMTEFIYGAMLVFVHPGLSDLASRHGGELSVDLSTYVETIVNTIVRDEAWIVDFCPRVRCCLDPLSEIPNTRNRCTQPSL